ncbi:hypothetical protein V3C99_016176, partial [Haemonchus contortus]
WLECSGESATHKMIFIITAV